MQLSRLRDVYAVARAATATPVPEDLLSGPGFRTISRSDEELSVVAPLADINAHQGIFQKIDADWTCFKLHGPFAFDEVGIVAGLSRALAEREIGIFVISTYDTDYILVKDPEAATTAWKNDGHTVE